MEEFIEQLLGDKKRMIIGSFSVFAGAVLLAYALRAGPDATAYVNAENAFAKWEAAPENERLYQAMHKAMQQAGGLKHEPVIAEHLFAAGKIQEGLVIAAKTLERVKEEAPYHSSYGETSLLIEQGNFQRALERAVSLKVQLENEKGLLYAYNLLRIACLQQELKNNAGEKAGLEELESYLQSDARTKEVFLESFSESALDLNQYIAERKRVL